VLLIPEPITPYSPDTLLLLPFMTTPYRLLTLLPDPSPMNPRVPFTEIVFDSPEATIASVAPTPLPCRRRSRRAGPSRSSICRLR